VAKEHGHRPLTVYAAWAEGAPESNIRAIWTARNPKEAEMTRHGEDTTEAPVNDTGPINPRARDARCLPGLRARRKRAHV